MRYLIRILLTPGCWVRNSRSGKEISRFIQERLAAGERPRLTWDGYRIELGGKAFWGANYPYAYGSVIHGMAFSDGPLPDRKTVFMLHDAVEEAEFSIP